MLRNTKNLFDNTYIQIAGILALFLSPFADAIGGNLYWVLSAILFILFLIGIYDESEKQKRFQDSIIYIPIVIKVDDGPNVKYVMKNLIKEIEKEYELENYRDNLQKYLGINLDDFIYEYNGSVYDFDRLMSFVRIVKYDINKLEKKLDGRAKYHLAYYKRPGIGFILGTIFRTEGLVVYQNNDFENLFYKVADINSRSYKERVKEFQKYDVEKYIQNENTQDLLIVINSASHLVNIKTSLLQEYENKIVITLKENGTIPYESDWTEYASEIYTLINQAQTNFSHIFIAHAMPESLAVILGMGLENYWNVDISQYDNGEYRYLFTMNQINFF